MLICPHGCGNVRPRHGWVSATGALKHRRSRRALVCPDCNTRLLPSKAEIARTQVAA
jgi:uncharacterized protein with PIN domain